MATAIPNTICLTATGHRRQGQTRRIQYTSLHGDRVGSKKTEEESKEKEEDVDAPPQDSSDEREAPVFEAEGYGEASDDSEFEKVKVGKPQSSPRNPVSTPEIFEKSQTMKLLSAGCPQQSMLQHSSQKRRSEQLSDEELNMSFKISQQKRQRRAASYGKSKAKLKPSNIHEAPPMEQEKRRVPKRKALPAKEETKSKFIKPPTEGLLAELNRYNATPVNPSSSALGKAPLDSKCSEGSSNYRRKEGSKRPVFKAQKLPSPPPQAIKAKPSFKRPTEPIRDENAARAKRSSSQKTKPLYPNQNRSNIGGINDSATTAVKKLGLEDVAFKVPSSVPSVPSPNPNSSATSGLSSPPTSFVDSATTAEIPTMSLEEELADEFPENGVVYQSSQSPNCPLCKTLVDRLFFEGFARNRRMTIREQAKFCQAHKRRTAEEEWLAKGYPTIDWPFLHMQVKIHSEAIDEILKGQRFSYYRNSYEYYLKREKHKTLQQSLVQGGGIEDFSPGYYGSRGARVMIDNLMSTFASKLRRRSSTDSLISSRGITNYVQAVLVPELATLLVMDDLKVDAEKARGVLRDSVELGNFLNEEEDEVIKDSEMDDMA